jgi:hypothetical protein
MTPIQMAFETINVIFCFGMSPPFLKDPTKNLFFCLKLISISLLLWAFAYWRSVQVPNSFSNTKDLQNEPRQVETEKEPFNIEVKNHRYQLQPVFEYELWGLIVEDHNSSSWLDTSHEQWGDFLNTKDICMIWGKNLLNRYLKDLKFSHGDWTCYVKTSSDEAWSSFRWDQLSNNHLLPGNADIERKIKATHIGDEIHLKGQLVNYSINHGPQRRSSITRTDRENGACEIIYVNELQIINRHNVLWTTLSGIGKWLSIITALALLFSFLAGFKSTGS